MYHQIRPYVGGFLLIFGIGIVAITFITSTAPKTVATLPNNGIVELLTTLFLFCLITAVVSKVFMATGGNWHTNAISIAFYFAFTLAVPLAREIWPTISLDSSPPSISALIATYIYMTWIVTDFLDMVLLSIFQKPKDGI